MLKNDIDKAVEILESQLNNLDNMEKENAAIDDNGRILIPKKWLEKLNLKNEAGIILYKNCIMISDAYNTKTEITGEGMLLIPDNIRTALDLSSGDFAEILFEDFYISIFKG